MKIKRLDIQGFKSFAEKTTLHFPKGITAIVGPNGCGKSNFVDAIRWVLGEHNARHLRGKHMEDVIFAGSDTRKPVGLAEVVLTLFNEEGVAPAAYAGFSEIEVTRRLYRSGESEYYINKMQCRMKDVVDLFRDTGIGTRAYSIVEQGQVGWLVNAKPDERRVLFEEAAGITRYKHRKEASLRRLESTNQNLTRVNDIISEVKRQMNSLNRQAKKAERFKRLKEELKGLELFLASKEYHSFKTKESDIHGELERLERSWISFLTQISNKEGLLEETRANYLKEEDDLKGLKEKSFNIISLISSHEHELDVNKLRIEALSRRIGEQSKEAADLKEEAEKTHIEKDTLEQEIDRVSQTISHTRERLHETDNGANVLFAELSAREKDLQERKETQIETLTKLAQIKGTIKGYLKDEDVLHLKTGKLRREREATDTIKLAKAESIYKINEDIDSGADSRRGTEEKIRATLSILRDRESELFTTEEVLKGIKEDMATTTSRLRAFNELNKTFDSYNDGVKAIMLGKENGSLTTASGVHGIIADFIETSQTYEKAVESALGEKLQYVLVDTHSEGIEAIGYLKANKSGRSTFVAVKDVQYKSTDSDEDVAHSNIPLNGSTKLLRYLTVQDKYLPVIRTLINDCLLVKDISQALDLWRRNGKDKTIVTLDGDVISKNGSITGGSTKGTQGGGILRRKREIKELSARVEQLDAKIKKTEAAEKKIKEQVSGAENELNALKEKAHLKSMELVNLEANLKREQDEQTRLEEKIEVFNFDIREVENELVEISKNKAELVKEREAIEISQAELEGIIRTLNDRVETLSKEKEEIANHLTDIKVTLASSQEKFEGLKNQHSAKEHFLQGVGEKFKEKLKEVENAKEQIKTLKSTAVTIKDELNVLLLNKDEFQRKEIAKEDRINTLNQVITETDKEVKVFRGELDKLEKDKNGLNISNKELELSIQHLEEKIVDRYEIAIGDYEPSDDIKEVPDEAIQSRYDELRDKVRELGEVSLSALQEYTELEERHEFLLSQQEDLKKSMDDLYRAINRINKTTRERFRATFDAINLKFQEVFPTFFRGGRAELKLSDEGDLLESGIEIVAQPPGKRLQNISLLSGGEKALTATSLIFSIFSIKPSPFCLLDEVDAPLDDANIDRFNNFLKEMSLRSQFILITHNKHTMEMVDNLLGVTMEEAGVSKVVSVQLT